MYGQQGMGSSYVTSTIYYFYSFGKTDKRRDVTLTFGRWRKENYEDLSLNATNVHYAKWRMYWTSETIVPSLGCCRPCGYRYQLDCNALF